MNPASATQTFRIEDLSEGPKVRDRVDPDHVAVLTEVIEDLPPILVRRCDDGTLAVLGGAHRVEAHRSVGLVEIVWALTVDGRAVAAEVRHNP